MQAQAARTTLSIDVETYRSLVQLAHRNERTTSAEARVAIRRHLEENVSAAQAVGKGSPEPAPVGTGGAAR
jgi:hypothetical protein